MKTVLSVLTLIVAGLTPLLTQAQTTPAAPNVAGVEFRVIVPWAVQLTKNRHPATTRPGAGQSLTVKTTVPGTCIEITNQVQDLAWSVDSDSPGWISKKTAAGYMYCTNQIGSVSLTLTHQFGVTGPWSVMATVRANT